MRHTLFHNTKLEHIAKDPDFSRKTNGKSSILAKPRKARFFHLVPLDIKISKPPYGLNCKINSTNGGTFSKSAEKISFVFFFRRPQYVQMGPGKQNFQQKNHPIMSQI